MSALTKFLSLKYGIDEETINYKALETIARMEGIGIEWIDVKGSYSGMICWGAHHRVDRPTIYLRGQNNKIGKQRPGAYFSLGHELGHYFLHPYLKYMDLRHVEELSDKEAEIAGMSQLEADQFSTKILIPQTVLYRKFEEKVIRDFLSDDLHENLSKTRKEIYQYCVNKTKSLLTIDSINSESKRNLRIRTDLFISRVREKVIIVFGKFPEDITPQDLSGNDISFFCNQIKDAYKTYQEIY